MERGGTAIDEHANSTFGGLETVYISGLFTRDMVGEAQYFNSYSASHDN